MTRFLAIAALIGISIHHGHCQELDKSNAKLLAFEVASITPCKPGTPEPPGEHMGMVQFTYPGGRFEAKATSLKYLMEWAYGILPAQHSEGAAWFGNERYDIVAKAPGQATDTQIKRMVQALIEERFKLKFHRENKEAPVVVLSVGKTSPKLFPPKDGEVHSIHITPPSDGDRKTGSFHVTATRYTLAQLIDVFSRQLGRVIVDETGLRGDYDFTLDLTPTEDQPNPLDPSHILASLRDDLGLVVKSQKGMIDYMTIDSAERVVAGN
jgi:uncharacterized protein (TIGR03435 family)